MRSAHNQFSARTIENTKNELDFYRYRGYSVQLAVPSE